MIEVSIAITTSVLSGLLLYFVKENIQLKKEQRKKDKEKKKDEDDLLLGVARSILIDKVQKALERGYTTQAEYEVIDELYKPYIKCGGNGTVKHLFEDRYKTLKVKAE